MRLDACANAAKPLAVVLLLELQIPPAASPPPVACALRLALVGLPEEVLFQSGAHGALGVQRSVPRSVTRTMPYHAFNRVTRSMFDGNAPVIASGACDEMPPDIL